MDELVGRVIRSVSIDMVHSDGVMMDLVCPQCGDYLVVMQAAYGWYATCRKDRVRWTHINNDDHIVAERWHPMNERDMLTGLPTAHFRTSWGEP
jgi:hypothetical protein